MNATRLILRRIFCWGGICTATPNLRVRQYNCRTNSGVWTKPSSLAALGLAMLAGLAVAHAADAPPAQPAKTIRVELGLARPHV